MQSQFPQRGLCVTPLPELLGIIAALAVAAFVIYPAVQEYRQGKDEAEHAISIVSKIHEAMPARNYAAINTQWANQSGIFPARMHERDGRSNSVIRSAWGEPVSLVASGPSQFALVYHNTPSRACNRLVEFASKTFNRVQITPRGGAAALVKTVASSNEDYDLAKTACDASDAAQVVFWGE